MSAPVLRASTPGRVAAVVTLHPSDHDGKKNQRRGGALKRRDAVSPTRFGETDATKKETAEIAPPDK